MKFKNRKVILFLDNAPCHPDTLQNKLPKFKLIFYQNAQRHGYNPLDVGIIRLFKRKNRKLWIQYVVSRVDEGKRGSDIIQDVTILNTIHWLQTSWKSVRKEAILNIASKNVDSKRHVASTLTLLFMRNFRVYSSTYSKVKTSAQKNLLASMIT